MAFSGAFQRHLKIALGNAGVAKEFTDQYDVATAGTAEASKAVVLDASKGIATITSATITTLTATTANLNAGSIVTDTTTGLKVGTGTTQKIGLYGVTPVVQPAGTGELIGMRGGFADNATNAVNMNSNGNLGTAYYNLNDCVKALKQLGGLAVNA